MGSSLEQKTQIWIHKKIDGKSARHNQKNCKTIFLLVTSVWNPIADVSEVQFEEISAHNPTRRWMELIPISDATILTKTVNNTNCVSNFFDFCLNNIRAPVQDLYASQKVEFFSGHCRPETLSWYERENNGQVQFQNPWLSFKTQLLR